MLGTRTVRDASQQLATLADDARSTLAEVKTAAHGASIGALFISIVAIAALLVASVALVRVTELDAQRGGR